HKKLVPLADLILHLYAHRKCANTALSRLLMKPLSFLYSQDVCICITNDSAGLLTYTWHAPTCRMCVLCNMTSICFLSHIISFVCRRAVHTLLFCLLPLTPQRQKVRILQRQLLSLT